MHLVHMFLFHLCDKSWVSTGVLSPHPVCHLKFQSISATVETLETGKIYGLNSTAP